MDEADRASMPKAERAKLEALGVDLNAPYKPVRAEGSVDVSSEIPTLDRLIEESPLSSEEKAVLRAYGEKGGLRPAAKALGVSHATVANREKVAFAKLKDHLAEKYGFDPSVMESATSIKDVIARLGEERKPQPGALFSGLPLHLTFLDRLLGKENLIAKAATKWLTSAGDLTPDVFAEKLKSDGRIAAYAQDVRNTEKDLKAAIPSGYASLSEAELKTMNDALAGNGAAMATLPPEVRDVLKRMRDQIDTLSESLIASGAIQGKLAVVVDANKGAYLNRAYRVFTDAKWFEKVPEDVKNRFISWMRTEIEKDGRTASDEEVQGIMEKLLKNGTAAENPLAFISKSKLGSKDLGILTNRKDVPEPLRALWGEFQDPLVNYANSVGRMAHLLSNHLFLSKVRAMGLESGIFSETPKPGLSSEIAPEGSDVMAPLAGLHTTPEIKRAFEEVYAKEQMPAYMRVYMKLLGLAKYAKTVESPVTHIRNAFGNIGFAIANGHYRVGNAPGSLRALMNDTAEGRAYYRRLLELGLAGDSVMAKEFKAVVDEALDSREMFGGLPTEKGLLAGAKSLARLTEKAYHAEDLLAKIYAFENEKSRYHEAFPEWTDRQVEEKAAENVRRTYPTYSYVPRAIKSLRRFPLAGPFVSFSSEVIRTTYQTARLAMEEMQNPATRSIGATRLAGLSMALGLSAGLAATTRALVGMDQDQEDALRRFLPDWSKDSQLLHLGRSENGEYKFIDLGRTDPHSYLLEPIQAALRGRDFKEGAMQSLAAITRPFTEEELLTRAGLDVLRNKNEQTGADIYNAQDSTLNQAASIGKHLGKVFLPGAAEQGRRLYMAAGGLAETKSGKQYNVGEEASALLSGQRVQSVQVDRSLQLKGKEFEKGKEDAVHMLNEVASGRGNVSDKDLQEAYGRMEAGRRKVYDDMRANVLAAQALGQSPGEIRRLLTHSGVSAADASDLLSGRYRPYQPTNQAMKSVPPGERNRRLSVIRGAAR